MMTPLHIRCRSTPSLSTSHWPAQLHPVLRRIYAARGISTPDEIDHRLTRLHSPQTFSGIKSACKLLEKALRNKNRIFIVGDFDADGATGTVVAVRGLRLFCTEQVHYQVPNRFVHGYGLSAELVALMLPQRPELIITVDNGIASLSGVAAANAHGIDVIVTDHHLPGAELPRAAAIVNPNLANDAFPSKALCGVGVIFYVLVALRAHMRECGWFTDRGIAEPDLSVLLDLVALGTVADLVNLDFNNRILVEAGLKRIRAGKSCVGIQALIEASHRRAETLTAADLGFALAPRINAAGRLEDMSLGIECLLTDDLQRARALAEQLSSINAERRELQAAMVEQGEAVINRFLAAQGHNSFPLGVVLFEPDWHQGVVGLVASKLKEKLHRPVIACAPASENSTELKASARSIPGFHIRDALAEIDAQYPGLLLRFGGHAMAAGMSLLTTNLDRFAAAFDAVAKKHLAPEQLEAIVFTDGALDVADFTVQLAQQLRYAGPWGQGFPEPLFLNEFTVDSWKVMGETHLRMKLRLVSGSPLFDGVMFGGYTGSAPPKKLRAVYQLTIDDWRGTETLCLLMRHIEVI